MPENKKLEKLAAKLELEKNALNKFRAITKLTPQEEADMVKLQKKVIKHATELSDEVWDNVPYVAYGLGRISGDRLDIRDTQVKAKFIDKVGGQDRFNAFILLQNQAIIAATTDYFKLSENDMTPEIRAFKKIFDASDANPALCVFKATKFFISADNTNAAGEKLFSKQVIAAAAYDAQKNSTTFDLAAVSGKIAALKKDIRVTDAVKAVELKNQAALGKNPKATLINLKAVEATAVNKIAAASMGSGENVFYNPKEAAQEFRMLFRMESAADLKFIREGLRYIEVGAGFYSSNKFNEYPNGFKKYEPQEVVDGIKEMIKKEGVSIMAAVKGVDIEQSILKIRILKLDKKVKELPAQIAQDIEDSKRLNTLLLKRAKNAVATSPASLARIAELEARGADTFDWKTTPAIKQKQNELDLAKAQLPIDKARRDAVLASPVAAAPAAPVPTPVSPAVAKAISDKKVDVTKAEEELTNKIKTEAALAGISLTDKLELVGTATVDNAKLKAIKESAEVKALELKLSNQKAALAALQPPAVNVTTGPNPEDTATSDKKLTAVADDDENDKLTLAKPVPPETQIKYFLLGLYNAFGDRAFAPLRYLLIDRPGILLKAIVLGGLHSIVGIGASGFGKTVGLFGYKATAKKWNEIADLNMALGRKNDGTILAAGNFTLAAPSLAAGMLMKLFFFIPVVNRQSNRLLEYGGSHLNSAVGCASDSAAWDAARLYMPEIVASSIGVATNTIAEIGQRNIAIGLSYFNPGWGKQLFEASDDSKDRKEDYKGNFTGSPLRLAEFKGKAAVEDINKLIKENSGKNGSPFYNEMRKFQQNLGSSNTTKATDTSDFNAQEKAKAQAAAQVVKNDKIDTLLKSVTTLNDSLKDAITNKEGPDAIQKARKALEAAMKALGAEIKLRKPYRVEQALTDSELQKLFDRNVKGHDKFIDEAGGAERAMNCVDALEEAKATLAATLPAKAAKGSGATLVVSSVEGSSPSSATLSVSLADPDPAISLSIVDLDPSPSESSSAGGITLNEVETNVREFIFASADELKDAINAANPSPAGGGATLSVVEAPHQPLDGNLSKRSKVLGDALSKIAASFGSSSVLKDRQLQVVDGSMSITVALSTPEHQSNLTRLLNWAAKRPTVLKESMRAMFAKAAQVAPDEAGGGLASTTPQEGSTRSGLS
jgi:hypothetical protein